MNAGAGVCIGSVMHCRHGAVGNRFSYPIFMLRLPLSTLARCQSSLFGVERWRLLSFFNRDHGPRDGSALLPWVRALLDRHHLHCADGEVLLLTMPRLFGYVFNPVSFFYCYDRHGQLRAVLCQVSNTFGERHEYLVAHSDHRPIRHDDVLHSDKCFHVSPFFAVRGRYAFQFRQWQRAMSVAIDYWDGEQRRLSTRLVARIHPLSRRALWRALLRCPVLTFGVVARIYWQAAKLVAMRLPIYSKPTRPQEEVL